MFLSAGNLINLLEQSALHHQLGMAEIFVLLLGEIDLSVGYAAGLRRGRRAVDARARRPLVGRRPRRARRVAAYGALQGISSPGSGCHPSW